MSVCEISVLDYLRKAAIKLELTQDDGDQDIYGLDESEIAFIINRHYQDKKTKLTTSELKRKGGQEDGGVNKKAKVYTKEITSLSVLEQLPNEIYEKILFPLGAEDKNNLRTTCKGLYEKTTAMDPRYNFWCFDASKGTPPDFVLNTDKKFCIKVLYDEEANDPYDIIDDDENDIDGDNIGNFINRFANRISSIKTDVMKKNLMNYLRSMKPIGFYNLTSLDLQDTNLDNVSLLQLAPQLENLKLLYMGTNFDQSNVTEDDSCFTKLRTLEVSECKIDVCKILTKCCNTLEHLILRLDFDRFQNFENLKHNLSSLNSLDLSVILDDTEKSVKNLLSKSAVNLKTLEIGYYSENVEDVYDFSTLLDQSMNITTLVISSGSNNIDNFLNNCPYLQNLTFWNCEEEIEDFVLKNLTKVKFDYCDETFVSSVLKQLNKSTVRTLHFEQINYTLLDELIKGKFSVLPELDTVCISWCNEDPELLNKFIKFFLPEAKLKGESLKHGIVFRREYNLQ